MLKKLIGIVKNIKSNYIIKVLVSKKLYNMKYNICKFKFESFKVKDSRKESNVNDTIIFINNKISSVNLKENILVKIIRFNKNNENRNFI